MVLFPELLQLRLFNGLCPDFGTVRGLVSKLSSETFLWSMMACCVGISMPQLVLKIKCHCLTKSDVFECQCVCSNMLT